VVDHFFPQHIIAALLVIVGYTTFKNLQLCITKTKMKKLAVEQPLVETFFAPIVCVFKCLPFYDCT